MPPIIVFPKSTPERLIFPFYWQTLKFDTNHYNPIMTNNRVSKEELDQFLAAVAEPLIEFRKKDLLYKYPWAIVVMIILIPLLYIFLIYQCCISCRRTRELNEAKDKCFAIIKENSASYNARGLKWETPRYYPRWIELWIGQDQGMMQPNFNTQSMMGQNDSVMVPMAQPSDINTNLIHIQQVGYGSSHYNNNNQFNNQHGQYGANMYAGNNNMNV